MMQVTRVPCIRTSTQGPLHKLGRTSTPVSKFDADMGKTSCGVLDYLVDGE